MIIPVSDEISKCMKLYLVFLTLLQHAVGYVSGNQYYGAKASINVWAPRVASQYEFSLSQMWVIAGSFGDDLNTIEAGWQACYSPLISTLVVLIEF